MSTQYSKIDDEKLLAPGKVNAEELEAKRNKKIIYITIFTVLAFTIEYLVRAQFTDLSEWIQERLTFSFKCELGSYFLWFKYQGKVFIFLFFYNISGVYASLSMIFLDSFGIFINGTLKLIYTDPRPFWRNENLVPCGCATNYGSPSTTSLDEFLVCIVIFRGLINRKPSTSWKVLVWIFFLTPQVLAWTSRFIQNIHSLPQLFFGLACGYIVQYIYFDVLEVDMFNNEQLKKLINNKSFVITAVVTILAWLVANGFHYFFIHPVESPEMIAVIMRYCKYTEFFMFDNESYEKTAKAFLWLGSAVGTFIEFHVHFNGDYDKYSEYNMGENNWTDTSGFKIFIRIIGMIVISKIYGPYTKFGDFNTDSLAYLNLGRCIIKGFVDGIFYFWLYKVIFRLLSLTNETARAKNELLGKTN